MMSLEDALTATQMEAMMTTDEVRAHDDLKARHNELSVQAIKLEGERNAILECYKLLLGALNADTARGLHRGTKDS